MTVDELKQYYSDLLIIQYANAPKAIATIKAFAGEAIADQIIPTVRDGFDLNEATGDQLDVLGAYRGVSRFVYGFALNKNFLTLHSVSDSILAPTFGFAVNGMTDADITWFWLRQQDSSAVQYMMNDQEYREVIKFAAAVHSSDLSVASIDSILQDFFGTYVTLTDNQNMTITYNNSPANPDHLFQLIQNSKPNLLPKPAGVSITVTNV